MVLGLLLCTSRVSRAASPPVDAGFQTPRLVLNHEAFEAGLTLGIAARHRPVLARLAAATLPAWPPLLLVAAAILSTS